MNNKKIIQTSYLLVVTFLISMLLLACGSGGGDDRAGINSPVYSISGTVSGVQAAVSLSLSLKATQATSSVPTTGVFSFSNLTPGAYQVTPSLSGYRFDPSTTQVTLDGINQAVTIPTFTAILDKAPTYTISGTVTGAVQQGVSLRLSGSGSTYTTGTDGTYRFPGLASERTYTITPTLAGYIFAKGSLTVVGLHTDTTAPNFVAAQNTASTYKLSGTVTGAVLQNILITLNNGDTTSTNASGVYGFPALLAASYTVTPSKLGYTFSPASATVAVSALTTVPDFIATGKLNDTGITNMQCYQAASAVLGTCTATAATALNAAQDGMVGRDVTVADSSDGKLGFSFTKVCNSGELAGTGTCQTSPTGLVLGNLADNWGCTQDNVTGLMWEIKTNDVANQIGRAHV